MSTIQVKRGPLPSALKSEGPSGPYAVSWVRERLTSFAHDAAGDVAMLFGLMAMAMFFFMGAAVDIGRWLNARDQTIAAIDSAVLAAGRALQTNGGNQSDALAVAQKYYSEAVKNRLTLKTDTINFQIVESGTAIEAKGNGSIQTPFMSLAGFPELPVLKNSGVEYSKATLAVGGNANLNLEISMMLDVSGSMCQPCSKLTDMKDAAADLVDIVVWADQSEYTSKVAIVPFSGDVRPPGSMLNAVTNPLSVLWPASRTKSSNNHNYTYTKTACVAERTGTNKNTDTLAGSGNYVMSAYTSNGSCSTPSSGTVMPLSNNKTSLTTKINGLTNGGGTAGHLGTAWAYYMLSPKWATLLPGIALPAVYTAPKTKKIAILMTDGEYNYTYDNQGIPTNSSGSNGSANGTSSAAQAIAICTQMKLSGIEVYTVGFDLGGNQTAINTLSSCATDSSKFYNADDGEQLKQSFRDIALKISTLYLSR